MKHYKIIIFTAMAIFLFLNLEWITPKSLFFQAVGKVESDSGQCLTKSEIKAIQAAQVTAEYKNYLYEADARTWNGKDFCRNIIN